MFLLMGSSRQPWSGGSCESGTPKSTIEVGDLRHVPFPLTSVPPYDLDYVLEARKNNMSVVVK